MTTLDTLDTITPDFDEVSDASLAMADFDAKRGDLRMALEWLAVAAHHRALDTEYRDKKAAWELTVGHEDEGPQRRWRPPFSAALPKRRRTTLRL
jgi:hypothetical protein